MENNFWTAISRELFDLRCSAQGKELEIISKDRKTQLFMRFDDYTLDAFRDRFQSLRKSMPELELPDWLNAEYKEMLRKSVSSGTSSIDEFISRIGSPKFVPTWTIKGKLLWGNVHLAIRDFEVEDLIRKNIFRLCFVLGGRTAFSFSDKSTSIGVS